jgi:hypothetical protein
MILSRLIPLVVASAQIACAVHVGADDGTGLSSTELHRLRERSEGVLAREFDKPLPKGFTNQEALQRQETLADLRIAPFRVTEPVLLRLLANEDSDVRLVASEILLEKSQARHKREILVAIENLKHLDDVAQTRSAAIRLKLNQEGAIDKVYDWAVLGSPEKRFEWFCPMHPDVTAKEKTKCPICGMELISKAVRFTRGDVQLTALTALTDRGDRRVPLIAAQLLASDVWPSARMVAAVQWARVNPDEGLHHVRVFLGTEVLRQATLGELAKYLPGRCVDDFELVLADNKRPDIERLVAAHGLVAAGHKQRLDVIRELVRAPEKELGHRIDLQYAVKCSAIDLLGNYGERSDLDLLQALLDSRFENQSAIAILWVMDRLAL